jgi:hypothetical protein
MSIKRLFDAVDRSSRFVESRPGHTLRMEDGRFVAQPTVENRR